MTTRTAPRPAPWARGTEAPPPWEFRPDRSGRPPGIDLCHDGRVIRRRIVSLADPAGIPAVVRLLEDARERGRAHGWCDQRAELAARRANRPDGHTHYRAHGGHLVRDQDGEAVSLLASDNPHGIWLTQMATALQAAFMLGQSEAITR
ncbi:hypothetical protein [Actinomadura sp. K4S16]|uniref:hypothetical protein n=1 Tax=Actinomadura sp. K4S16 TaxID=1316147 RepID=UPI0011ED8120|nr:hypothetical protein [Actinomadura sp. K4S16]